MIRWSLVAEFFAFIVLIILFLRYCFYERTVAYTLKRKYYLACLGVSVCSILLDTLCVTTIAHSDTVPLWINLTLNSLYFMVSVLMCSMLVLYLFTELLEHVYDKHCIRKAFLMISILTVFYAILIVCNLSTGILFYFDEQGEYQRGILNFSGYGLMLIEGILLIICYFRNRRSVCRPMIQIIRSLPPLCLLCALFQIAYPEILMNGALAAIANLIIFICFQSRTLDRDGLTGIRNRNNFLTELNLRIGGHQEIHIMLIYLQKFSDVNQHYGYQTGDSILYEIADYLERFSPAGRAFRFGNVTFALVLPWNDSEKAGKETEQVCTRFQQPWIIGDLRCHITCSIADLPCTEPEWSAPQVIEYLEYALNLSRQSEKGLVYFDTALHQCLNRRKYLIETLRASVQEHRFKVWYQPIYCCHTGQFRAAEALLRLTDYNGEAVSPEIFIPIAEEIGIIDDLSWIVMEEVCRLLGDPAFADFEYISVNASLQSFLNPELTERMLEYLNRYGVSPEKVKIEITERVLLHDMRLAKIQMEKLVQAGIQIYIDDFGTGYSNFSFVLESPFECVKIDRSLVKDMLTDPKKDLTVQTLMKLFHTMKKKLVMEGVETQEQARKLVDYGADMIQGFYYARPMPDEEFRKLLWPQ